VSGEGSEISYDDFLFIGSAGRGKTTTADKLLAANPTNYDYKNDPVLLGGGEIIVDAENRQLRYTDITMWLGTPDPEFQTHLKFLDNCRKAPNPHVQINNVRRAALDESSAVFQETTQQCEVLSNDRSKVRVMDVPGFFDGASILSRREGDKILSPTDNLNINNLGIMRSIIRIQTTLGMKFKRVIYFIPGRGPLERADAVLKLELRWMAHFFGRAIFKIMVLIATVSSTMSELELPDDKKFSDRDVQVTKRFFRKALEDTFRSFSDTPLSNEPLPDPPLVFISQTNTCEEILVKIKSAAVTEEGLNLQIDKNTCSQCGVKIGEVKGQRVTCYFGEDLTNGIPYEESTCHPQFIPKYRGIDKFLGGLKYLMTFKWVVRKPWPVFVGEKCIACGELPTTQGCMQVGKPFKKGKISVKVDHTNEVPNDQPAEIDAADEHEQVENAPPPPPPVENGHRRVAQNGSIEQQPQSNGGVAATQEAAANRSESSTTTQIADQTAHMSIRTGGPSDPSNLVMQNPMYKYNTKGT
jgi:hypothetical protein